MLKGLLLQKDRKKMEKLLDLIKTCVKNGIRVECYWDEKTDQLGYRVFGFAKSDSVDLFIQDEKIIYRSRYDYSGEIGSFDDLIDLAFEWYSGYKDRGYEPNADWLPFFLEKGYIKEKTVKTYVIG